MLLVLPVEEFGLNQVRFYVGGIGHRTYVCMVGNVIPNYGLMTKSKEDKKLYIS